MTRFIPALLLTAGLATVAATAACKHVGLAPNEVDPEAVRIDPSEPTEADRVELRTCLIGFEGTGQPGVTRSEARAEEVAGQVLALARGGRDFGDLVRLYSDDHTTDGTVRLANFGVPAGAGEAERLSRGQAFGALAFSLAPGGVGLLPHDPRDNPLGWYVVQRLR